VRGFPATRHRVNPSRYLGREENRSFCILSLYVKIKFGRRAYDREGGYRSSDHAADIFGHSGYRKKVQEHAERTKSACLAMNTFSSISGGIRGAGRTTNHFHHAAPVRLSDKDYWTTRLKPDV